MFYKIFFFLLFFKIIAFSGDLQKKDQEKERDFLLFKQKIELFFEDKEQKIFVEELFQSIGKKLGKEWGNNVNIYNNIKNLKLIDYLLKKIPSLVSSMMCLIMFCILVKYFQIENTSFNESLFIFFKKGYFFLLFIIVHAILCSYYSFFKWCLSRNLVIDPRFIVQFDNNNIVVNPFYPVSLELTKRLEDMIEKKSDDIIYDENLKNIEDLFYLSSEDIKENIIKFLLINDENEKDKNNFINEYKENTKENQKLILKNLLQQPNFSTNLIKLMSQFNPDKQIEYSEQKKAYQSLNNLKEGIKFIKNIENKNILQQFIKRYIVKFTYDVFDQINKEYKKLLGRNLY